MHRLLLRGTGHPLGGYYPSVMGAAALPAADAGPALESFGRPYAAELAETIRTRLVQTSVVQRTLGLRIGLSAIAAATPEPMAGLLLRDPAGHTQTVAVVDGHLRWIETLEPAAR